MTTKTLAMTERGKGETVVLLHGWGMNSQLFEPLSDLLSSNYHIISVDLPGHGASEPCCSLTLDEVADQLLEQIEGTCHWVGWSLGGTLLMRMAQLAPARFKSITLIAATPCFVKQQNWSHGIDAKVLKQFSQALTQHPIKTLKRFAALQVLNSHHGNATLKRINELAFSNNLPNQESLQQGLKLLLEQDQRPVLKNLQMPMLVLLGECDALIPLSIETYYRQLHAQPQVHIIEGAGHTPFLSHPDMTAELLDSFLQQHAEKVQAHG
jgi:pimeloyl-[acyl-carrier protein] methyl ester esterase